MKSFYAILIAVFAIACGGTTTRDYGTSTGSPADTGGEAGVHAPGDHHASDATGGTGGSVRDPLVGVGGAVIGIGGVIPIPSIGGSGNTAVGGAMGEAGQPAMGDECVPGTAQRCQCEDGSIGFMLCLISYTLSDCTGCGEPIPPPTHDCLPGSVSPCLCDDNSTIGTSTCTYNGIRGVCTGCEAGVGGTTVGVGGATGVGGTPGVGGANEIGGASGEAGSACTSAAFVSVADYAEGDVELGSDEVPMMALEVTASECEDVLIRIIELDLSSPDAPGWEEDSTLFCRWPCESGDDWNFRNVTIWESGIPVWGPIPFSLTFTDSEHSQTSSYTRAFFDSVDLGSVLTVPSGHTVRYLVTMDVADTEVVPVAGNRVGMNLIGFGANTSKDDFVDDLAYGYPPSRGYVTIVEPSSGEGGAGGAGGDIGNEAGAASEGGAGGVDHGTEAWGEFSFCNDQLMDGCCTTGGFARDYDTPLSGMLIKSDMGHQVYYYGSDQKRYVLTSHTQLASWYGWNEQDPTEDPDICRQVREFPEEVIVGISYGGNMTIRPGTYLVRIASDPKVYVVSRHATLRFIGYHYPNPDDPAYTGVIPSYGAIPGWVIGEPGGSLAYDLFNDPNERVRVVHDAFFVDYTVGEPLADDQGPIPDATPYDPDLEWDWGAPEMMERELGIIP